MIGKWKCLASGRLWRKHTTTVNWEDWIKCISWAKISKKLSTVLKGYRQGLTAGFLDLRGKSPEPLQNLSLQVTGILTPHDSNFKTYQKFFRPQVYLSLRNGARFHFGLKYQNCWQLNLIVWISSLTECTVGLSSNLVLAEEKKAICRGSVNFLLPGRMGFYHKLIEALKDPGLPTFQGKFHFSHSYKT